MKKLYSTAKHKRRNTKRSINRFKRELVRKRKKSSLLRSREGYSKEEIVKQKEKTNSVLMKAPSNFSFIDNTEGILIYLEEIIFSLKRRKSILVDLRDISNLSNDAVVLLMAVLKHPDYSKFSKISGNYPKNERLRTIFEESGIFGGTTKDKNRNYIITRQNKKADGKVAAELIKRAAKVVFGADGRCPGVYKALMESMANTCYHAKDKSIGRETWWLSVYHDSENNTASFAFVDLGMGIFKSSKMTSFKDKLSKFFGLKDNVDVLKEIISGRKLSRTRISYRGKGLPSIYNGLVRNYYCNLKIISNNVKADLEQKDYQIMKKDFNGTFLYWELKETNRWVK